MTPRKRGRPPMADAPAECVSIRLPPALHDEACRLALERGISISQVVREAFERSLLPLRTVPPLVSRPGRF